DLGAAQLAEIVEEAPDHGLLRLLAVRALDPPGPVGARHRHRPAALVLEDSAADPSRIEAEDRLVAQLAGGLAECPERPLAEGVDGGLVGALGVDLLLRALGRLAAD